MPDTTYRTVTPYLLVNDADAELAFLEAAFGATTRECHRTPAGAVMHAEVTIGDSLVMLGQANERWPARSASIYLWVDDVDGTWQRGLDAGGASESEPVDKPYGHRNAAVRDPNGNSWWIAAPTKAQG